MKKEFNVNGLDCGHCALTLEKYIQSVKGVNSCSINFSTSKLFLDIEESGYRQILKNIFKLSKQVNPDVTITENNVSGNKIKLYDIMLYIIGVLCGLMVLFLDLNNLSFYVLLLSAVLLIGYKTYYKAILQLRRFTINENTLITISVLGAIFLGESLEAMMVIALYTLGKMLESKAVNYSRKSISSLISTQPEYAVKYEKGIETKLKPETIAIDDMIIVKAGEKVALDGIVLDGSANIDKRHLTGESTPVSVACGDIVESGSIVLDSSIIIKVTSEYKDSAVSKILNMVSDASSKKSKTETFISKFSSWYTLGVIISAILVWGITWLILKDLNTAIYRGLIFLVVSCPCAFAISVPLSYFSGIGKSSERGILIKGSNYLDTCAKLDRVVFDKTGTITTGQFIVIKVETKKSMSERELLKIVATGEKNSLHPIAKAICQYYKEEKYEEVENYKEIHGKGIEFEINGDKYFVGKNLKDSGDTVVEVYKNNKSIGKIFLRDEIKDESIEIISKLKALGIKTTMLTGDVKGVARRVAKEIGVDEYSAELMPEDKFEILQDYKKRGERVAFVGDGINDAPALTLSDIGISMGIMGSPATIESSDVVIADDNISKIYSLIKISKRTKRIVLQNIIFAGITKLTFLILGACGITGMLLAVFADVGVTLLAILNSLRVLTYKEK